MQITLPKWRLDWWKILHYLEAIYWWKFLY